MEGRAGRDRSRLLGVGRELAHVRTELFQAILKSSMQRMGSFFGGDLSSHIRRNLRIFLLFLDEEQGLPPRIIANIYQVCTMGQGAF